MTRVSVVTGAASGIGKATTELLRSRGETVITVDIRDADIIADLATTEGREVYAAQVAEVSGGAIDAVIAVAGLVAPIPATVGVNYFGAIATLELVRPLLLKSDSPRAVIVSSLAALGQPDQGLLDALLAQDEPQALLEAVRIGDSVDATGSSPIYGTTKYAISRWVRKFATAPEWAEAGIAVNGVAPGVIRTPMIEATLQTEEGLAALKAGAPAPLNGPAGNPDYIAGLLAYLTSAENGYISGQVIFADGGAEAIGRPELV